MLFPKGKNWCYIVPDKQTRCTSNCSLCRARNEEMWTVWLLKRQFHFQGELNSLKPAALSLTAPPLLTPLSVWFAKFELHSVSVNLSSSFTCFHSCWGWDEGSSGWELRDQLANSPFSGLCNHSPYFAVLSWQVKSLLVEVQIWQLKSWYATSHANVSVRDLLGEMDLSRGFGPEWIGLCCLIDPRFHLFFVCFSSFSVPHALFHSFLCILGAGGRSCQPPARPGRADPHWGADNWAAVIPWRIPAWREARHPRSALESCQPSGPWETAQVVYPLKHTGCYVTYGLKRLRGCGQMWILTSMVHIAVSWLYNIWFYRII